MQIASLKWLKAIEITKTPDSAANQIPALFGAFCSLDGQASAFGFQLPAEVVEMDQVLRDEVMNKVRAIKEITYDDFLDGLPRCQADDGTFTLLPHSDLICQRKEALCALVFSCF